MSGVQHSVESGRNGGHVSSRSWWIYRFDGGPVLPPVPAGNAESDRRLGVVGRATPRQDAHDIDMINTALLLRRPLLVTGRPGIGKSTLAYLVARELGLGRVLHWGITSRSTLRSGLYEYDAIGRAQASLGRGRTGLPVPSQATGSGAEDGSGGARIGDFVRLGPLGTALLPYELPRVLLIDELDKSDIDLPSDLLHVLENGSYDIPELVRARHQEGEARVFTDDPDQAVTVTDGRVKCRAFPFIVITSNGERHFPPAFLRRFKALRSFFVTRCGLVFPRVFDNWKKERTDCFLRHAKTRMKGWRLAHALGQYDEQVPPDITALCNTVTALIETLRPRNRAVWHMTIEGYAPGEIADALDIKIGDVNNPLYTFRTKVKTMRQQSELATPPSLEAEWARRREQDAAKTRKQEAVR
ncbi:AAA family ATPase [Streptomyces zaomyceticus]|uniref:AAA family ATPase n=1 Tax=Streptomyces zaomyceticus TaxID=68286 RepID=UPI00365853A6